MRSFLIIAGIVLVGWYFVKMQSVRATPIGYGQGPFPIKAAR